MDWQPYNYTSAFREPYRIRSIGRYIYLPIAIVAVDLVSWIVWFLLTHFLLGGFLEWIGEVFFPFELALYVLIPCGIVTLLNRIRPDGKKIYFYIWGRLVFYFWIQLPEKVFFGNRVFREKKIEEKIRF